MEWQRLMAIAEAADNIIATRYYVAFPASPHKPMVLQRNHDPFRKELGDGIQFVEGPYDTQPEAIHRAVELAGSYVVEE